MNDFQRARTDEQRAARRDAILDVARRLVVDEGVAHVSLNEIAREVGLAKSNVLRYFETREAILLTLLGTEYQEWVATVVSVLPLALDEDPNTRVAATIASTLMQRPLLCDLLASAPTVLEQNLSASVALDHKGRMTQGSRDLLAACSPVLGTFDQAHARGFMVSLHAFITIVWAAKKPSPGMALALEQNPDLRTFTLEPEVALRELLHTFLIGMEHQPPRLDPPPPDSDAVRG